MRERESLKLGVDRLGVVTISASLPIAGGINNGIRAVCLVHLIDCFMKAISRDALYDRMSNQIARTVRDFVLASTVLRIGDACRIGVLSATVRRTVGVA